MLYYLLRFIFRIANKFYFRNFQVIGQENIPKKNAVVFVANHPSAFMDPIVIATITNRRLFFLAKGTLFNNKFSQWLLSKFNMIPIFSSGESKAHGKKNKEVFSVCYKHLAKGGSILVFPEGISRTERILKKIQSGTARICLGAEAEHNFKLNIAIIPIGLNFSDPHSFHSNLLINIDKPIFVSDYYKAYQEDTFKAAHAITDEIRNRLEQLIIATQDANEDRLVANIETLYKSQLLVELGLSVNEMQNDFETTKAIRDSVHHFIQLEPERVEAFDKEIKSYLDDLERLKLNDLMIKGVGSSAPLIEALKSFLFLLIGFPVFIFGFINNFLPYRIPSWIAKLITNRPDFFGSIALTVGTSSFLFFYSLQIWLLNKFVDDWRITLAYIVVLPFSGLFAFYYYTRLMNLRGKWTIFSLFYKKTTLVSSLISRRKQLIDKLKKGKEDFLNHPTSIKS